MAIRKCSAMIDIDWKDQPQKKMVLMWFFCSRTLFLTFPFVLALERLRRGNE